MKKSAAILFRMLDSVESAFGKLGPQFTDLEKGKI